MGIHTSKIAIYVITNVMQESEKGVELVCVHQTVISTHSPHPQPSHAQQVSVAAAEITCTTVLRHSYSVS